MVRVSIVQCTLGGDCESNLAKVQERVREAADQGGQIILLPELFSGTYFCQKQESSYFSWAQERENSPLLTRFSRLAKELGVVIPVSFFEKAGPEYFNSVAMIDADGQDIGLYRKSHIPDGPGYQEKFYFRPGDTGYKVFDTRHGRVGIGICWDQWFPECARAMTLKGAQLLLYPTAIGSEPEAKHVDSMLPWKRVMVGHAVANAIPVAAANRAGKESALDFGGMSFLVDHRGEDVIQMGRNDESVQTGEIDLVQADSYRDDWGFFRDRRSDLE